VPNSCGVDVVEGTAGRPLNQSVSGDQAMSVLDNVPSSYMISDFCVGLKSKMAQNVFSIWSSQIMLTQLHFGYSRSRCMSDDRIGKCAST
jgi:hypothetical protein